MLVYYSFILFILIYLCIYLFIILFTYVEPLRRKKFVPQLSLMTVIIICIVVRDLLVDSQATEFVPGH